MFKSQKVKAFFVALMMLTTAIFSACGNEKTPEAKDDGKTAEEKPVVIGTMNLVNGDLIAQYEKWYENELGTKVKVIRFDSGKDVISALASNSIDIGEAGTSPAALAISNNLDIKVIFVGDVIGAAETLVAKNDSGISSVKDLAGKKVATPFASTAHYSLLNALKLAGMTETDCQLLDLQPDDIFAAWQRGDIDAAYVWYPVLGRLMETGKSITNSEELASKGIVTADLVVARTPFIEEHPDVVKKFIEIQLKANDMILDDPQKAAKEIASVLEISEKDAAEQITQFKYLKANDQIEILEKLMAKTLKDTADFLVEQKSIKTAPSLEDFNTKVTAEFVKNASAK